VVGEGTSFGLFWCLLSSGVPILLRVTQIQEHGGQR
jgi:hypothetical protein